MLLSLVKTIAETRASLDGSVKEEMELIATVSSNLNAFDKRWVEQPDFDTRLEAFKTVQTLLDSGKLSVDLGVIVIHHCFYVIREVIDSIVNYYILVFSTNQFFAQLCFVLLKCS